jgi:Gpi18-like mannosyltransferase
MLQLFKTEGEVSWREAMLIALALFALHQLVQGAVQLYLDKKLLDWCLFDCYWYSNVALGYDATPTFHDKRDAADWAFFPLFPLLARAFNMVTGVPVLLSLVVTSKLCFLAAITVFIRYCSLLESRLNPWITGSVLALTPYSIYADAGYSESLFLLSSLLALLALHNRRYVQAGIWGALLSATRVVGGGFGFAFVVFVLQRWRSERNRWLDIVLGLSLVPLGLALFMAHLYFKTGDALAFSHIQVAWNRVPQNPLNYLEIFNWYYGFHLGFGLFALAWLCYRRHYPLAMFALVATLLPLTTGLWAMPRYIWWQAPLLVVAAEVCHWRGLWRLWLPLLVLGLIFTNVAWLNQEKWLL